MKLRVGQTSDGQIDARDVWYVPMFGDGQSDSVAVGATTPFTITLAEGHWYVYSANTDSWINQGAAGVTATKGAGSMFIAKGAVQLIDGAHGPKLACLQDAVAGQASLMEVTVY